MQFIRRPSAAPDLQVLIMAYRHPDHAIVIPDVWMHTGHVDFDPPDDWLNPDHLSFSVDGQSRL
jgi:hypothetical protein